MKLPPPEKQTATHRTNATRRNATCGTAAHGIGNARRGTPLKSHPCGAAALVTSACGYPFLRLLPSFQPLAWLTYLLVLGELAELLRADVCEELHLRRVVNRLRGVEHLRVRAPVRACNGASVRVRERSREVCDATRYSESMLKYNRDAREYAWIKRCTHENFYNTSS